MKKTETKPTKEQLQKQLSAIIRQEQQEILKKNYPLFKKKDGTFYKTRNSLGIPNNKFDWFTYTKITEIKPDFLYSNEEGEIACFFKGWSFESTNAGDFLVERDKRGYVHTLGKQISEKEFVQAWNKAMAELDKLG